MVSPSLELDLVMQDLLAAYPDRLPSDLADIVSRWSLTPYHFAGLLGGVGLSKGSEFHFLPTKDFKLDRKAMRSQLTPLFERHGFLTTRVAHEDKANQRFNRLFGFEPTWADANFQYFMMTKLPFGERTTCPQSH